MSESEWLECADPTPMLECLRDRASERKLRLFAVACCYHLLDQITVNPWDRKAVDVAELFADGKASLRELEDAAAATTSDWTAAYACAEAASPDGSVDAAIYSADNAVYAAGEHAAALLDADDNHPAFAATQVAERQVQAALLRCIVGPLPFRTVSIKSEWLAWNDATVVKLAGGIYDGRAFDRLPILADALEEAGCDNADILTHLRGPGPHVRGCWVVDLLAGRS
jgi:hypothetical protein